MAIADVRDAARYRWLNEFQTPLGRTWRPRIEAAEAYFQENSGDWDYLRDLFVNMVDVASTTWSTTVAIGYSTITFAAADSYFSNPESWIQAKSGDPNGDVSRAFRDIANTIHRDADTEGIMGKCLICEGFAGYGVHWGYFEQTDDPNATEPVTDAQGQPVMEPDLDDSGAQRLAEDGVTPLMRPQTRPKVVQQKVCGDFCEPWDFRVDPDGRDWKLKDHKYVMRKYRKTIAELVELPFASADGKAMLYTWARNRRQHTNHYSDSKWGSDTSTVDDDIGYMPVDMWEIWDRVSKTVIHIPVGADFDLGSYPWPRAWRYANAFPATFVAFNWEPGDRARRRGFYPIPLLRLIRNQIENINRLEGLYMEAATSAVIKFLTVKGLLEDDEITALTSDRSRVLVSVDLSKVREFFPAAFNSSGDFDLRKIFHMLEAEDKGAAFEFENAINHEMQQIARVVGAGAQDRFGLPEAKSATEAAGLIDAMGKRGRTKAELAANKYDEITEKFFLILKTMQTLPIDYEASTPDFSEGTWRQWTNLSAVRTMNLAYRHRVGSSSARDPRQEATARNAAGQLLLTIYQAAQQWDKVDAIARWMLEPQDFRDLDIFRSESKQLAMELAYMTTLVSALPQDQAAQLASDPAYADRKADIGSQLALSLLSPADMQSLAKRVNDAIASGEAMVPPSGSKDPRGRKTQFQRDQMSSRGSLPGPSTAGQDAFAGAAAAGMTNVG